ncbi:glucokinase [Teichococcus oryzae]|uniref:Glucokinase n=1 Tax=Teichococcus oryzae TaxID=1608942 RepID=A0A5B2TBC5_9PROT|nr:glucokinase [Pseudoroseomonas oryzae]KAA2211393.1 glucokinase [Pseudoroseomonas oryzae]
MIRLLGDLGGTHARFALSVDGGPPQEERKLRVAEHAGVAEAARIYLEGRGVDEAVFAVATPVQGDRIAFTNNPWHFSIRETEAALGLRRLTVINDFVAQAASIPVLREQDLRLLKPGQAQPDQPSLVIGPGTGLGVAFIQPEPGGPRILPSEGGHMSFAPQDALQAEILAELRARHGHVSAERLVSGPGLLALGRFLAGRHGSSWPCNRPEDVSEGARNGEPACVEAVRLFCSLLGAAAGNLALALLTGGGVYVMGGLCRNLGPLLDVPALTGAFQAKGRFEDVLRPIPIIQVVRPHAGLIGAAAFRTGLA